MKRPPCFKKAKNRGKMLNCRRCHFKNECINDNLTINITLDADKNNTGEIKIEVKLSNEIIGSALFYIDENKIVVSDFGIDGDYQKQGYGRILMRVVQAFGELKKLPIVLFSEQTAIEFYKKCGFSLADTEPDKFGNRDMHWTPNNIQRNIKKKLFPF